MVQTEKVFGSKQYSDGWTTDNCESFHKHFNYQFTSSHPNIFVIYFKWNLIKVDLKIITALATPCTKRKRDKKRENKRLEILETYRQEVTS